MTNQPNWLCIGNIYEGDEDRYGFVLIDKSGVYCPELWLVEHESFGDTAWNFWRVMLERCVYVKQDGEVIGIGDNPFHTDKLAWFGEMKDLRSVHDFMDIPMECLMRDLVTDNVMKRAYIYGNLVTYWGVDNFDSYPDKLDEDEGDRLINSKLAELRCTVK